MPHAPDDGSRQTPEITITIGPDGRVYFLDLTPGLLAVAAALCPDSPQLQALQAACEAMKPEENHGQPDGTQDTQANERPR